MKQIQSKHRPVCKIHRNQCLPCPVCKIVHEQAQFLAEQPMLDLGMAYPSESPEYVLS